MFKIIILLLIVILSFFAFKVDGKQDEVCLKTSYELYKENFMSKDGRIIDYGKNNITTSEGQSYMLLRSLVMDDKTTFDLVWKWTKDNLQRQDCLFAWLWGKNSNNEYKILDENSASDADVDIAFALILAKEQWNEYQYLKEAGLIINSIWNNETKRIGNYLVLMPGVKQTSEEKIEVNPSYFSPYAFKYFQKCDDLHDWSLLVNSSYHYLEKVMSKTETGLPPNWFLIANGSNGEQIVFEDSKRSDFSYDAIRVFARIYLDYLKTGEKRALPILEKSMFFVKEWEKSKTFYTNYQVNGQLRDKDKFIGSMAILIPAISLYDKKTATQIYDSEIKPFFKNEKYWSGKNDYYDKNLSWFAYYLYGKNPYKCKSD